MDYVRWVFNLDFCTPRYLIIRELGLDKLRIGWKIKARMYGEKIRKMKKNRWVKRCWKEKERKSWEDLYGRERERYYNRNGWGICAKEQ